jgi:hypothetical protein
MSPQTRTEDLSKTEVAIGVAYASAILAAVLIGLGL